MVEIFGERVTLKFATEKDRATIYEMMICDEIGHFMFDEDYPAPSLERFKEKTENLFPAGASEKGSYLLIYYEGKLAGTISYICGYTKIPYAELDMWLAGYEFMGKKIGCDAIHCLRNFIHDSYGISHYIIRPWTKNLSAIQAYNRCGFHETAAFNLGDYYSEEEMAKRGSGHYGQETVTLYHNRELYLAMAQEKLVEAKR